MKVGKIKIQTPADAVHALEKLEQYVAVILFNVICSLFSGRLYQEKSALLPPGQMRQAVSCLCGWAF